MKLVPSDALFYSQSLRQGLQTIAKSKNHLSFGQIPNCGALLKQSLFECIIKL